MFEDTSQIELFYRFGVAISVGLLVGLQREYAHWSEHQKNEGESLFAGARTFPLLALFGCTAALLADVMGSPLLLVAAILAAGLVVTVAYYFEARSGSGGITTEVAALTTVMIGALCYFGDLRLAAALGVAVTVLLALKLQTRALIRQLEPEDVYATLQFAVITIIILPLLPRTGYGPEPLSVLVPYKIWLMVVFISGISFLGYILIKLVGTHRGVGLTGILGGLASSTAVTLSFSQRSRSVNGLNQPFALAILLSWSVMFVRVLVEVAALNRSLLRIVWIPMAAALAVTTVYCIYLYRSKSVAKQEEEDRFTNPFELGPALGFGLLFAVVLLISKAATMYLGDTGIYLSSVVAGFADVDAITLSMAELSRDASVLDEQTAARAIVLAVASNTLVKGAIVLSAGSPGLKKVILPGIIASLVTAIGVVFLL
ncbi:MAG: MgtC/SapB family protein [Rhodothermales bacterium]|nr:MgtC/SapB family protein [Rhodothermales bacterium]